MGNTPMHGLEVRLQDLLQMVCHKLMIPGVILDLQILTTGQAFRLDLINQEAHLHFPLFHRSHPPQDRILMPLSI
jgi:hypothetical protein